MFLLKSLQIRYFAAPAVGVFFLDQITKLSVVANLSIKTVAVMPYINFHLAHNKGAAFGILATAGGWQRWAFIVIALIISVMIFAWSKRLGVKDKWEILALGLVMGGAWGNLVDRIRLGYVIDFIDFYIGNWHWYTFNVADIAICVGTVLLILFSFRSVT